MKLTFIVVVVIFLFMVEIIRNGPFEGHRNQPNFRMMETSWKEQRAYLYNAVASLDNSDKFKSMKYKIIEEWSRLNVTKEPSTGTFEEVSNVNWFEQFRSFSVDGYQQQKDPTQKYQCDNLQLSWNQQGAINFLLDTNTGRFVVQTQLSAYSVLSQKQVICGSTTATHFSSLFTKLIHRRIIHITSTNTSTARIYFGCARCFMNLIFANLGLFWHML